MREFAVRATAVVADEENLTDAVWANAERFPGSVTFRRRVDGSWVDVTAQDFSHEVAAVAKGLIASGVEHGDRVALMSRTRYEWTLFDYAIWAVGASTVPIYETCSVEQVEWILSDSGARVVLVETDAHRELVQGLVSRSVGTSVGGQPVGGQPVGDQSVGGVSVWQVEPGEHSSHPGRSAVDELTDRGGAVSDDILRERASRVGADDQATLIYTSGTTGRPKGCELTHRSLLAQTQAAVSSFPRLMQQGNSILLFLPLAHVFARIIQCCCVYARITLGHTPDVKNLVADLGEFRPTFLLSVPRVFEKVYNSAKQKAHAGGRGRIFDAADAVAEAWSRALDTGGPGLTLRAKHALFDRLVYAKLRAVLGGRCLAAVSGGAPLGERLGHFFRGIGLPVLEGYGLTETSAATTLNTEGHMKVGTVGRPLPGVTIRIAEDGEVLITSPGVMRRYWNDEQATAEVLGDGWFHSGDLGELDDEGFLRITGRKKEIIVTAAGKNVAPAVLEDRIRAHRLISQCMVVGDQQPFVAALVTLDTEAIPAWAAEHGKPEGVTAADLTRDPDLLAEIQRVVDDANSAVSQAEAIRRFRVLPIEFTEADGQLTPTLKLKRSVVAQEFATDIDSFYAQSPAPSQ